MKKILVLICVSVAAIATVNAQTATWGVKAGANYSTYKVGAQYASPNLNLGNKLGFYVGAVNNLDFCGSFGLQTELLYSLDGTRLAVGKKLIEAFELGEEYEKDFSLAVSMHNIKLPIMMKFQPGNGLSIMAGPYVSYTVATTVRGNKNTEDLYDFAMEELVGAPAADVLSWSEATDLAADVIKDNINKFDVGASLGVEYQFNNGLFIDFRYNISLLNTLKKDYDISAVNDKLDLGITNDDTKANWKKDVGVQPKLKYSSLQLGVGFRF